MSDWMPTGTDWNSEMKTDPQIFLKIFLDEKSHNCCQNHHLLKNRNKSTDFLFDFWWQKTSESDWSCEKNTLEEHKDFCGFGLGIVFFVFWPSCNRKTSIFDRNADITLLIAPLTEIVTMCIYSGTALNKRCELTIATPASHCRYAASKIRQTFLKKYTWILGKHLSIPNCVSNRLCYTV